jgi:hypothetical protein
MYDLLNSPRPGASVTSLLPVPHRDLPLHARCACRPCRHGSKRARRPVLAPREPCGVGRASPPLRVGCPSGILPLAGCQGDSRGNATRHPWTRDQAFSTRHQQAGTKNHQPLSWARGWWPLGQGDAHRPTPPVDAEPAPAVWSSAANSAGISAGLRGVRAPTSADCVHRGWRREPAPSTRKG